MARPVHQRPGERGFALLIVFVMAAAISIGLYMELPRSVFESQRAKEETLFDRGEQYKMGIKRYYTKFQRYPNTIEELEQTNGTRYLRRRYKDPFTGKDDWKILKFGPNGEIEGSVHNKKKTGLENDKDPKQSTGSVVAGPSLGDLNQGEDGNRGGVNGAQTNPALNRRPSDTGIGAQLANGAQGGPGGAGGVAPGPPGQYQGSQNQGGQYQGGQYQNGQYQNGQNPSGQYQGGQYPPQNQAGQYPAPQNQLPQNQMPQNQGQFAGPPNFGGLAGPGTPNPNIPQYQNGTFTGPQQNSGNPGPLTQQQLLQQQYFQQQNGQNQNGQPNRIPGASGSPFPGLPGQAANSQTGGQIGVPFGSQPNNGQNPALQMINQLLTSPRQGVQVGQLSGGALGGGMPTGIAGVVSKHKGQGIKVLDERTKIHEWEFIYDVRKDKSLQKGGQGMQQSGSLPGSGLSNSSGFGQPSSNGSGSGQGSGFGQGSGSGQGSGFGGSNNGSNNGIGGPQNRRQ